MTFKFSWTNINIMFLYKKNVILFLSMFENSNLEISKFCMVRLLVSIVFFPYWILISEKTYRVERYSIPFLVMYISYTTYMDRLTKLFTLINCSSFAGSMILFIYLFIMKMLYFVQI